MTSYVVKTPNFSYVLETSEEKRTYSHVINFLVGDPKVPCLEAFLYLPGGNDRIYGENDVVYLNKIEALEQCALEYNETKSFGTELLYSFINIIRANYPHIKKIHLFDASNIRCDRKGDNNLDLLVYSIALYGKTWYELKAGAYLEYEKHRIRYKNEIESYISPLTKENTDFKRLVVHTMNRNKFAQNIIENDFEKYETMYNESKTLPDFFRALSKNVPKADKCRFFRDWLEPFIGSRINIQRDWIINIDSNETLKNVLDRRTLKTGTKVPVFI